MAGHVSPKRTYYTIFGALMVLTAVTVAVAFVNLGVLNFPIAITIAVVKATLVVLFFMHVKYSSRLTKLFVGMAVFFLFIMLTLTMTDYLSRGFRTFPGGAAGAGYAPATERPAEGAGGEQRQPTAQPEH